MEYHEVTEFSIKKGQKVLMVLFLLKINGGWQDLISTYTLPEIFNRDTDDFHI